MSRRVVIHNHLPRTTKDDIIGDAELNYSTVMKGWMFRANGKNFGPFKEKAEAEAKLAAEKK